MHVVVMVAEENDRIDLWQCEAVEKTSGQVSCR